MDGTGKNLASLEVVPCFGIETFGRSDRFQLWLALHLNTELNLMNQVGSTDTRQKHFAKEGASFFSFSLASRLELLFWIWSFSHHSFAHSTSGFGLSTGSEKVLQRMGAVSARSDKVRSVVLLFPSCTDFCGWIIWKLNRMMDWTGKCW